MEKNNASHDHSDRKSFALLFWLFLAKIGLILLLVVLIIWLIQSVRTANQGNKAGVTFGKVLGAAYSSDGNQLRIGTGKGIAAYEKGRWKTKTVSLPGAVQLVPVEGGFFTLNTHQRAVLRTDNNKIITSVRLPAQPRAGLFTAAYATRHLYFLNGKQLYSSENLGKSWNRTFLKGVQGAPQMLAADPKKSGTLAVATHSGLYVTEDQGVHFKAFLRGKSVTAVSFGPGGKTTLFAGLYGNQTMLYSILPQYNKEINLDLDTVKGDRLVQIARNPKYPQTTTVITANGDAYLTENGGQNWTIIAKNGRGLSQR
ncbi:hypothetical protein [Sporolactobacillus vineae]|uniref:hypothetical protein n=1 Tax=Sporolactobacillus vineae TaxID=444463 RepID=UPI0002881BD7|nr:hypothetical protein [Sporolactobacillus vineae]